MSSENEIITSDPSEFIELRGHIKWFDPDKGFGFVKPLPAFASQINTDVLLHKTVLNEFGYKDADEGADISGLAKKTSKGWQLAQILELTPPAIEVLIKKTNIDETLEDVEVKWFDEEMGYGFVKRLDDDEDIFLHAVVLKNAGYQNVKPDQTLRAVIGEGPKGKHVKMIEDKTEK